MPLYYPRRGQDATAIPTSPIPHAALLFVLAYPSCVENDPVRRRIGRGPSLAFCALSASAGFRLSIPSLIEPRCISLGGVPWVRGPCLPSLLLPSHVIRPPRPPLTAAEHTPQKSPFVQYSRNPSMAILACSLGAMSACWGSYGIHALARVPCHNPAQSSGLEKLPYGPGASASRPPCHRDFDTATRLRKPGPAFASGHPVDEAALPFLVLRADGPTMQKSHVSGTARIISHLMSCERLPPSPMTTSDLTFPFHRAQPPYAVCC